MSDFRSAKHSEALATAEVLISVADAGGTPLDHPAELYRSAARWSARAAWIAAKILAHPVVD